MAPEPPKPAAARPASPTATTAPTATSTSTLTPTYLKPQPRPPRSPAQAAQIRVQNRRREYLERHPGYFESLEHELADPLLYDALIRRFQSAEEREREGRAKGYSRVLEVDLLRGEAKLSRLAQREDAEEQQAIMSSGSASVHQDRDAFMGEYADSLGLNDDDDDISRPPNGAATTTTTTTSNKDSPAVAPPQTREEGRYRWDDFLRRRFVLGRDDDFDYRPVDEDDVYDAVERREQEDSWFDAEDPGWATESLADAGAEKVERPLQGETGVQDF